MVRQVTGHRPWNGWPDITPDRTDPRSDLDIEAKRAAARTRWLVGAAAASVLACLAVTFLIFRVIFPKAAPVPTISWGTLTPTTALASPVVQASPTTTPGCTPEADYVEDVTIPDDTVLPAGEPFLKTWRVRNSGTCPWASGYTLRFASGEQMGGPASIAIPSAQPGEVTELSVALTAPDQPGTYRGDWHLCAGDAPCFGPSLYVQIAVGAEAAHGATPTETESMPATPATNTPEPGEFPLPLSPGASEWLVSGSRALGVREIAWDETLNGFTADDDAVYLSLYIIAISTGNASTIFSPLEITVVDGDGEIRETLILERKDPPFSLCTAGPGATCEGWWTTALPDKNKTKRTLILRWEPSLLSAPLETPILQ